MGNDHTFIEPDGVNDVANRIGPLLDDQTPFEEVSKIQTFSGNFPAACSLDHLLGDWGKALLAHSRNLQDACHQLKTDLQVVIENLQGTDSDNANKVAN